MPCLLFSDYYIDDYKQKELNLMSLKQTSLIITVVLLISNNIQAQFWKKIKDKANKKVEQKVDAETDKTLNKILDGKNKENKTTQNGVYTFTGKVTIEVTSEGEKANFNVLFNANKEIFCMHMNAGDGQDIYNVISPKEGIVFMNASGMKIKKSMPSDQFSNMDYSSKIPIKSDLKKTGNTKTILGYLCEEYKYENDGGVVSAWVTKNFPIKSNYAPMLGMTRDKSLGGFMTIGKAFSPTWNWEKFWNCSISCFICP